MITMDQYTMGRDVRFPLTDQMKKNASYLLDRITHLENYFGKPLIMTSGYRPHQINMQVPGAAPLSTHETCEGIDLHDANGILSKWLLNSLGILKKLGLYMEDPASAKDHVHLQTRAPKSGKRVFIA